MCSFFGLGLYRVGVIASSIGLSSAPAPGKSFGMEPAVDVVVFAAVSLGPLLSRLLPLRLRAKSFCSLFRVLSPFDGVLVGDVLLGDICTLRVSRLSCSIIYFSDWRNQ